MGLQSAARELGVMVEDMAVDMSVDSSGAKAFASRRGLGRIRHVEVRWLWLQQAVAEGRFKLHKVQGAENPADMMTKYKNIREYFDQLGRLGVALVEAVADGAGGSGRGEAAAEIGWICLGKGVRWSDAAEE